MTLIWPGSSDACDWCPEPEGLAKSRVQKGTNRAEMMRTSDRTTGALLRSRLHRGGKATVETEARLGYVGATGR